MIDGGFVDVGSVIAMDQVQSERAFQEMLLAALKGGALLVKDAIAFVVMVAVLLVRPQGLFGRRIGI